MFKLANHISKGGVGKTTISGNVAYAVSQKKRTVLIDADPQGNTSNWFLVDPFQYELADILTENAKVEDVLIPIKENFFILPTYSIDGQLKTFAENQLSSNPKVFNRLYRCLEEWGAEVVITDLSPGMSLLEKYVLSVQDEVMPVMLPEIFSYEGVEIFSYEIEKLRNGFDAAIQFERIIVNMLNKSYGQHRDIYEEMQKKDYEIYLIPQHKGITDAQASHKSIFEWDPKSKAIPELIKISDYVIRRS